MCIIGHIVLHGNNVSRIVAPKPKSESYVFERNRIKAIKESETFVLLLIDN